MVKFFVASDIHSAYTQWMKSLDDAGFDKNNTDHKIIVCGDLFDRFDETMQTYLFAKEMSEKNRLIYIRGNHEDLLFDCIAQMKCGQLPSQHHFSNGTIKTICQFCGQCEWIVYDPTWRDEICNIMQPILDWIDEKCVDYFEVGDYVFVHGWVPCYEGLDDFRNATKEDWAQARWDNGMKMWHNPECRVGGKTVVCGHYHCSWGWSHIKRERKEFPQTNRKDWKKSFEPFVEDGIMAIDACTAYSGLCNVVVIEEE
jgi:serine/threonine protein phosphatase 1